MLNLPWPLLFTVDNVMTETEHVTFEMRSYRDESFALCTRRGLFPGLFNIVNVNVVQARSGFVEMSAHSLLLYSYAFVVR